MKKSIFYAIALIFTFSSCSTNVDIHNNNNNVSNQMLFGSRSSEQNENTKAIEKVGQNWIFGDKFGVFATLHTATENPLLDGKLFDNELIIFDKTWAYSNIRYWPRDETNHIKFLAYYPYSAVSPLIQGGRVIIPFEVNTTLARQRDLLWASILGAQTSDRDGTSGTGVHDKDNTEGASMFTFKHALSKVEFTAKLGAAYENATIEITSLKLLNPDISGNFVVANTLMSGTWDSTISIPELIIVSDTNITAESNKVTTDIDDSPLTEEHNLLILPQSLSDVSIELSWRVTYGDGVFMDNTTLFPLDTAHAANSLTPSWIQNTAYSYNFVINLDKISFDVEYSNWGITGNNDLNTI